VEGWPLIKLNRVWVCVCHFVEVPGAKRRRLSSPTIGCDTSTHQQDCQIGSGGSPVSEASNQLEKMQVAGEDPFKLGLVRLALDLVD